ncbi:MAG TPA: 8-amino-7-oxononanoate synthase [Candidatus Margulisiibacteriota bacterium]|nr:8-amino-7-oxononanoate synthase [Candidatus Margulisiibacteriota bacterium]
MSVADFATCELARRQAAGLVRRLRPIEGAQDTWVTVDGRRALLLCSNNYLGLATHPAVREAASRAALEYGAGAGASRLISGSMRLHHTLEEQLAAFKGTEAALLFNSGYHANIGAITALVGEGDAVFSDALNHASIIDGCRQSRAAVSVYPHNDVSVLSELLAHSAAHRRLVVTESIFSMDGDTAPLAAICDVAQRYGAMVLVDEAHATGVVGPRGAGVVAALGLQGRVTLQMGTLGKALGSFGAFVAGRRAVVDLLINTARSFIYTTALPPAVVAAASAALAIVVSDPTPQQRLAENAARLWQGLQQCGLQVPPHPAHIIPVLIGDAARTMRTSERLLEAGVFVQGIRPPTVPPDSARLRVTMMSTHTPADLHFAAEAFQRAFAEG